MHQDDFFKNVQFELNPANRAHDGPGDGLDACIVLMKHHPVATFSSCFE